MEVLILIPARSGSTRVKNKNIRLLGNVPLLAHSVTTAKKANIGRVVVSTDSPDIAEMAKEYGAEVPFLRPKEYSDAKSPSLWCILHALEWFKEEENWTPEFVVFTPPTNPFLKSETVVHMLNELQGSNNMNSIVTISHSLTHPLRIVELNDDKRIKVGLFSMEGKTILDYERSQDMPDAFITSPACRITRTEFYLSLVKDTFIKDVTYNRVYDIDHCLGHVIDRQEAFDIDDEFDFSMAQHLIQSPVNL